MKYFDSHRPTEATFQKKITKKNYPVPFSIAGHRKYVIKGRVGGGERFSFI